MTAEFIVWVLGGAALGVQWWDRRRKRRAALLEQEHRYTPPVVDEGLRPEDGVGAVGPVEHAHAGIPHAHSFGNQRHQHPKDEWGADPVFEGDEDWADQWAASS